MRNTLDDKMLMDILRVTEVRHVLAHTNKGELCLCLRKAEQDYFLTLDSVPLDKDESDDVMELLFPKAIPVPQPMVAPSVMTPTGTVIPGFANNTGTSTLHVSTPDALTASSTTQHDTLDTGSNQAQGSVAQGAGSSTGTEDSSEQAHQGGALQEPDAPQASGLGEDPQEPEEVIE